MASKKGVKKEFGKLAGKIEDLKEIEEKLDSLDTRGFSKEDTYIRSRLKDVKALPVLKKRIKILEQSILERNLKAGKGKLGSELLAEQQALKDEVSGVDRDLDRIEERLEKKRRVRKQLRKEEVADVKDIPAIEKELKRIKEKFSGYTKSATIRRRITELENLIKKKRRVRRQLSDEEVKDVKGISGIEGDIRRIKKAVDSVSRKAGRKQLSRSEVSDVGEISKLAGELNVLEGEMDSRAKKSYISRKLGALADYVKRKTSKKQLTRGEISDVKDIPRLDGSMNEIVDQMDSFAKASYLKRRLGEIEKRLDRRTKITVHAVGRMGADLARKEAAGRKEGRREIDEMGMALSKQEEADRRESRREAGKLKASLGHDRREGRRELDEMGLAFTAEEEANRRAAKREVAKLKASLSHDRRVEDHHFAILDEKINVFLQEFMSHEEDDKRKLGKIHSVLKEFKREFENVLDNELAEYATIERKLDHSQDYVKVELPRVEHELAEFKREFEEHLHSADIPIDTGVGTLVDSRFDDFVSAIKAGVTGKVKENMRKQQRMFNERLDDFKDQLKEEFEIKVNTELRREVEERFDRELSAALKEEKREMLAEFKKKNDRAMDHARRSLRKHMQNRFKKEISEEKDNLRSKMYDKVKKEVVGRLKLEKQKLMGLLEDQYKAAELVLDEEIEREVQKLTHEANRDGKAIEEKFIETKDGDIITEVRRVTIVRKPEKSGLDGEENSLRRRLRALMGYDPEAGMPDRDRSFYDK